MSKQQAAEMPTGSERSPRGYANIQYSRPSPDPAHQAGVGSERRPAVADAGGGDKKDSKRSSGLSLTGLFQRVRSSSTRAAAASTSPNRSAPPPPYTEPPPSYSEATTTAAAAAAAAIPSAGLSPPTASGVGRNGSPSLAAVQEAVRRAREDDSYAFLATFDVVFLVDDSGSMWGPSWRETREVLAPIASKCIQYDADGIDIYFMNKRSAEPDRPERGQAGSGFCGLRSAADVARLFDRVEPRGATPTGMRLRRILAPYLAAYRRSVVRTQTTTDGPSGVSDDSCGDSEEGLKPLIVIVITDGVPSDDVESEIVWAARLLDGLDAPAYQVGIQFFQVGDEPGAGDALAALDDDLHRQGVRDMVDTVRYDGRLDEDTMRKTVLGSVIRRLDRAVLS